MQAHLLKPLARRSAVPATRTAACAVGRAGGVLLMLAAQGRAWGNNSAWRGGLLRATWGIKEAALAYNSARVLCDMPMQQEGFGLLKEIRSHRCYQHMMQLQGSLTCLEPYFKAYAAVHAELWPL